MGRLASHSADAEKKRAENRRRNVAAVRAWRPSDQPAWLNKEAYRTMVRPRLPQLALSKIQEVLEVSKGYATQIKSGERIPHERHWKALARVVGLATDG